MVGRPVLGLQTVHVGACASPRHHLTSMVGNAGNCNRAPPHYRDRDAWQEAVRSGHADGARPVWQGIAVPVLTPISSYLRSRPPEYPCCSSRHQQPSDRRDRRRHRGWALGDITPLRIPRHRRGESRRSLPRSIERFARPGGWRLYPECPSPPRWHNADAASAGCRPPCQKVDLRFCQVRSWPACETSS